MNLRVELWNNSKSFQTDWNGSGQPTSWGRTPATVWSAAFHHSLIGECACIRHFRSLSERVAYVKQTFAQYSPEADDLTAHKHEDIT